MECQQQKTERRILRKAIAARIDQWFLNKAYGEIHGLPGVPPSSPIALGAGQSGLLITSDGWSNE